MSQNQLQNLTDLVYALLEKEPDEPNMTWEELFEALGFEKNAGRQRRRDRAFQCLLECPVQSQSKQSRKDKKNPRYSQRRRGNGLPQVWGKIKQNMTSGSREIETRGLLFCKILL
ncbi:MAG: hypothetical protein UX13_C0008G0006 [Candidatus Woesebacteria bacterium GW2011_GWB1_45_5]|uniref:Uncharacterized protein n=1 Tax=Candidatus Woesebacteria bacterium GW2011_GWB1_45_5 TaxID=1618581 RepID=A0A0G1QPN0_9BACT|nr:MAG: hypothetical protein UX13_C0008G0006 [Candidatus Woesebacteria bacterium GW2011_GWB1_45_5]